MYRAAFIVGLIVPVALLIAYGVKLINESPMP